MKKNKSDGIVNLGIDHIPEILQIINYSRIFKIFYEILRFTIVSTRAPHYSLTWAR
jgi:hypothetical protein